MSSPNLPVDSVSALRRRLATVLVDGLDDVGLRIAEQLIQLGIGTVLVRDERPLGTTGTGARGPGEGRPRAEVACRWLQAGAKTTAVVEAPAGSVVHGLDLQVIVFTGGMDIAELGWEAQNQVAVLPVELSAHGFCIGPVCHSHGRVCLECLAAYVSDEHRDPSNLAHQSLAAAPQGTPEPVPSRVKTIASELACQQVELLIAGQPAASITGALIGQSDTGLIGHRGVEPYPECQCLTNIGSVRTASAARRRSEPVPPSPKGSKKQAS